MMARLVLSMTTFASLVAAAGLFVACTSRNPASTTEPTSPPPTVSAASETGPTPEAPTPSKADGGNTQAVDASKEAPATLAEAHARLDEELSAEDKQKMAQGTERDMSKYHHGLGTWVRNNFGLWQGGPLAQHLGKLGLRHPDDMSGVILASYWCHLKGRPFDISKRVAYYDAYWQGVKAAQEKASKAGSKTISVPNLSEPAPLCPDPAP